MFMIGYANLPSVFTNSKVCFAMKYFGQYLMFIKNASLEAFKYESPDIAMYANAYLFRNSK